MKIKSIELNNFRIYNGKNLIDLTLHDDKNIIIVSGENGFGKTTFLMSIVWCLYGKQMEYVDEMYKTEISSKRGYPGYMASCLNKTAHSKGQTKFSVSLTITDLELPEETKCEEIKIVRSYDIKNSSADDLCIFFDGKLIEEIFPSVPKEERIEAEEHFIRERIMPIEIAKFFFFDAERIVTYAKMDTDEQRLNLASAYSQVLGIQKYINLRESLAGIRDGYRKNGINSKEREEFNRLSADIENDCNSVEEYANSTISLRDEYGKKKHESDQLQERLLREGDTMSAEQLSEFRELQVKYQQEMTEAQEGLKELYNYIPFGLSGSLFAQLVEQVKKEARFKQNQAQLSIAEDKTNDLLNDLDEARADFAIDRKIRRFYEEKVKELIKKHFYNIEENKEFEGFEPIHDLTELQSNTLLSFVSRIKGAKKDFETLYDNYNKAKRENYSLEQKIRDAEARAESPTAKKLKEDKQILDDRLEEIIYEIAQNEVLQKQLNDNIVANKKRKEALSHKIQVADQYKNKDRTMSSLIKKIDEFLLKFKDERRVSLEKRILNNLTELLHKSSLVSNVKVYIQTDLVDISLYGYDGNKLEFSDLSMGERQMFSTALLGALVEETGLDFPVFIDSPMQKFDTSHSKNILQKFYPTVSKQVVLFPLLHKELTPSEFKMIDPHTEKAVLIVNSENGSSFKSISKEELFNN